MLNYWCDSENQKQALKNTFEENERKYQEELKEKYNPNNIFNNQNTSTISEQDVDNTVTNQDTLPMDYATFPWYKKLVTKIRSFIYKLFKGEKIQHKLDFLFMYLITFQIHLQFFHSFLVSYLFRFFHPYYTHS